MPKKSDAEREKSAIGKAWKALKTERRKAIKDRHKALRTFQRGERRQLLHRARQAGIKPRDAATEVDRLHRGQHRDLHDQIAREERDRLDEWRRQQDEQLERIQPGGWTRNWPIVARVLDDQRSLDYWTDKANAGTNEQFVSWLADSQLPRLRRPLDLPDFDELKTIDAVGARIAAIHASGDRSLTRKLQNIIFPLKVGRPRKQPDENERQAKEFRANLTKLFQRMDIGDNGATAELNDLLITRCPGRSREDFAAIIRQAYRTKKKAKNRASAAAAYVASKCSGVAASRLKRGRVQDSKSKRRRTARVIAVADLERVRHAKERAARGRRRHNFDAED